MIGIYFSGTGNSKYCTEKLLYELDANAKSFSIEDNEAVNQIALHNEIVIGYPVQYSNIPKILKDFISDNKCLWKDKQIFIIATMGLFSGDGAGVLGRALEKHGAKITGGIHLTMPDSICDEKVLKRSDEKNKLLIKKANKKIKLAISAISSGSPPQEGLGSFSRMAGFFSQRLFFSGKTEQYTDKLKISKDKCTGCGKCIKICPLHNIYLHEGRAIPTDRCTMCYRCVNACSVQAITLLGKNVIQQYSIEQYL